MSNDERPVCYACEIVGKINDKSYYLGEKKYPLVNKNDKASRLPHNDKPLCLGHADYKNSQVNLNLPDFLIRRMQELESIPKEHRRSKSNPKSTKGCPAFIARAIEHTLKRALIPSFRIQIYPRYDKKTGEYWPHKTGVRHGSVDVETEPEIVELRKEVINLQKIQKENMKQINSLIEQIIKNNNEKTEELDRLLFEIIPGLEAQMTTHVSSEVGLDPEYAFYYSTDET